MSSSFHLTQSLCGVKAPRNHGGTVVAAFFGLMQCTMAWSPGTSSPTAAAGFSVDPMNRTDVLSFYNTIYRASESYVSNMAWTGSLATGRAGTTSAAFKEDVRRRINFYRALSGVPADIVFDSAKNEKCEESALMMSANGSLNHYPPATWRFYTPRGAEAAGMSNLSLGAYGPGSIDDYMVDPGAENYLLGHRRWLLYSLAQEMATGDVPDSGASYSSNVVWVIGNFKPSAPAGFTTWPNKGYVPQPLVPTRWSLSYPGADFSSATVIMNQQSRAVPMTVISRNEVGYGDNTIVWEPTFLPPAGLADTAYEVTVSGIAGEGVPSSYTYPVTAFNPGRLGIATNISGSSTPSVSGQTYGFNPVPGADLYELRISTGANAAWAADAETTAALIDLTAAAYPLTQTAVKRSGSKAFQLTFPGFDDGEQGFEIDRTLIPTASSLLSFYDLFRFASATTRLSAELSTDSGSTWKEIWFRNGSGSLSSSGWDKAFIPRSVSLAAYAGQPIRIRFMLRFDSEIFDGIDNGSGVFLDDITVSSATELVKAHITTLPGTVASFVLNASTNGAPLIARSTYYMQIRANVGTRWFGEGELKVVTAQVGPPELPYDAWLLSRFALQDISNGLTTASSDFDKDGMNNLLEYAFGTDPKTSGPSAISSHADASKAQITFPCDTARTDLTYIVEFSPSLASSPWTLLAESKGGASTRTLAPGVTVADRGAGLRSVSVTINGPDLIGPLGFMRIRVTSP